VVGIYSYSTQIHNKERKHEEVRKAKSTDHRTRHTMHEINKHLSGVQGHGTERLHHERKDEEGEPSGLNQGFHTDETEGETRDGAVGDETDGRGSKINTTR